MTPKEKAKELVDKFRLHVLEKDFFGDSVEHDNAKQCALIAVDEILASKPSEVYKVYSTWIPASTYWINVKEQIEKL
jgi:hypothetical protein